MSPFTKVNHTRFSDALLREAAGLRAVRSGLQKAGVTAIRVPEILEVDSEQLTMSRIEAGPVSEAGLIMLGEGLARLHAVRQDDYGWPDDNYIGLSPQPNGISPSWGDFFVQQRLGFQVGRITAGAVRAAFQRTLASCGERLARWLDQHCDHPSLLHGDLWGGNVLFDQHNPWLIDPAVYCGDREADLAMTEMFGGFGQAFYQAYDRIYARTAAYPVKRSVYNLYHYLNHYNLFGTGYLGGCRQGMSVIEEVAVRS